MSVFNLEKTDYENPKVLLGENYGFLDSIHMNQPEIWENYLNTQADEWVVEDFDFTGCNAELKACDPNLKHMLITTLAYQWSADSVAAHSIASIASLFTPCHELWMAWLAITKGECVHALSYSEMVRGSFDNPDEVLKEFLVISESFARLSPVADQLTDIKRVGLDYQLNGMIKTPAVYQAAYKFPVILLFLERLQFVASFAVTFAICNDSFVQPIGQTVCRIAKDELEGHSELDMIVIRKLHEDPDFKDAIVDTKTELNNILDAIVIQESEWTDFLFKDGGGLLGVTPALLKSWVAYNAKFIYDFLGYTPSVKALAAVGGAMPDVSPLPFMRKWLDMSKRQSSLQEERGSSYKVGALKRDDHDTVFDIDF